MTAKPKLSLCTAAPKPPSNISEGLQPPSAPLVYALDQEHEPYIHTTLYTDMVTEQQTTKHVVLSKMTGVCSENQTVSTYRVHQKSKLLVFKYVNKTEKRRGT